ncbi:MAG: M20 family metallopeptidase, partial [Thermomicrobiales bacterium]|nr:M20 family metallopeptidase [Thermomicrobiales bacterium]
MTDTVSEASVETARQAALAAIDAAADSLVRLSRFIHSHPEIALQEYESSAACAEFLEERGFAVERGVAELPTAFSASVSVGEGEPHIAYLSEYDALPNLGHGCGHNLIAIAGIGAGVGLAAALRHLPGGRVSVFGTPAEEAVGGKILMANAGIFEGVDAAMGAHPGTSEAACPTVEGSGQALACVLMRISFEGKAAHAAADPYNGANALNGVILTFNGIDAMRQHVKADARIHGIITHGGDAPNVVPHYAAAEFFVRGATVAYMNELVEKVRKIAEGAALMTGTTVVIEMPEEPNFDMIVNYPIARQLKRHLGAVGLAQPEARAEPASGSTDWGNVSYLTPSVETSYPILDRICTWHSQDVVDASDSELGYANTLKVAKAMALTGIDLLTDSNLLDRA